MMLWLAGALAADLGLALTLSGPGDATQTASGVVHTPDASWSVPPLVIAGDEIVAHVVVTPAGGVATLEATLTGSRSPRAPVRLRQEGVAPATAHTWTATVGSGRAGTEVTLTVTWTPLATPPPPPEAPPPGWAVRRYHLLWHDATLHPDVYRKGPAERLLPDAARASPAATASPWRVVGPWQATVREVESVPPDALTPHCHGAAPTGRAHGWQRYVVQGGEVPVTTRPVRVDFADGTGVWLAAGVGVLPRADGAYDVDVLGLRLTLPLPPDAVGTEYRPSAHLEVAPLGLVATPGPDGVVGALGGAPLRSVGPLPLVGRTSLDDATVVARTPCAELRLRVPPASIGPG